jgi:hypothetical protein
VTAQIFADGSPGKLKTRVSASGQVEVKKLTDWLGVTQPLPVSGPFPISCNSTWTAPTAS